MVESIGERPLRQNLGVNEDGAQPTGRGESHVASLGGQCQPGADENSTFRQRRPKNERATLGCQTHDELSELCEQVVLMMTMALHLVSMSSQAMSDTATIDERPQLTSLPTFDAGRQTSGTPNRPTITVVIPTLNEAANLGYVLELLPDMVSEVIIVDGYSTDATVAVALSARPDAKIVYQDGKGKGDALTCGFKLSTGEITVMLDADGSTDPAEIPRFVAALTNGYDFAKGTRFMTGGGSIDITPFRRLGNRCLTTIVNRIWHVKYSDLCYGYNAFWTSCLPVIANCPGFEVETLMNIRLAASKTRVIEVPSVEACRLNGTSNLRVGRDGFRVFRTILAECVRPR